jgi:hypothetical protein
MADRYIWIPNWFDDERGEGFQHYRDRDPIWIKNYTRLLSHDAYTNLSHHLRGILHSLWMEYARSSRRLRGDTLTLSRRLGQRVLTRDIEALSHAGFVELIASDVLATRLQDASPRVRPRGRESRGREESPPTPPQTRGDDGQALSKKDLRRYTGCRRTRGTHGVGYKHDPLGTDRPPLDWPYEKPSMDEVLAARAAGAGS